MKRLRERLCVEGEAVARGRGQVRRERKEEYLCIPYTNAGLFESS